MGPGRENRSAQEQERAEPASSSLPKAERVAAFDDFLVSLKAVAHEYKSTEWGPGGLKEALKDKAYLENTEGLLRLSAKISNVIEKAELLAKSDLLPSQSIFVLRQTALSDSFIAPLFAISSSPQNDEFSRQCQRLEESIGTIVQKSSTQIKEILNTLDEDELLSKFGNIAVEATDRDSESLTASTVRIKSVVEYLPDLLEVMAAAAANQSHPLKGLVREWAKEREESRKAIGEIYNVLLDYESGARKAPAVRVVLPPPPPSDPESSSQVSNKQQEPPKVPTSSILDGIEGITRVGVGDKRNRGPQNVGSKGGDKREGMAPFFQDQFAKKEAKERDRRERMAKFRESHGLKADPTKGKGNKKGK